MRKLFIAFCISLVPSLSSGTSAQEIVNVIADGGPRLSHASTSFVFLDKKGKQVTVAVENTAGGSYQIDVFEDKNRLLSVLMTEAPFDLFPAKLEVRKEKNTPNYFIDIWGRKPSPKACLEYSSDGLADELISINVSGGNVDWFVRQFNDKCGFRLAKWRTKNTATFPYETTVQEHSE